MVFWIIVVIIGAVVGLVLARAMVTGAGRPVAQTAEYDLRVYRDQLAEVDKDVARGVISAEDAAQARTEISRRILAADAALQADRAEDRPPQVLFLVALGLALIGGSTALYSVLGVPGYGDL